MFTLPGYQILEELYESAHSRAYRARREEDVCPVVIKVLKDAFPSPHDLAKVQNEYEIIRSLSECPGVVRAVGMERVHNSIALITEDFGAESLKKILDQRRFGLEEALEIGVGVAAALVHIHAAAIIHKDINPANILYNDKTGEVRIIDFGISSRRPKETPEFVNADVLEGTLAYISPEQTGRMNRAVDFRTDYYSFGATLYHLLTGRFPFPVDDLRTLISCHISQQPTPPQRVEPSIPRVVSDLVMKLLAKTPEFRYQSALGIKADLQECLGRLKTEGAIAEFPLGERDFCERLLISQRLYGRDREIQLLLEGFERARAGGKELMLICGDSGIGKTVLVREVHKPLTQRQGIFLSGRSEALQRSRPYSPLIDAFRGLVRQILSEPRERFEQWKAKLQEALGPNGQIILEILPEFERVLGPQPSVPELPPVERQNRFQRVFEQLVCVFASPEHPLVLFLDDLQWADIASLNLIQKWLVSPTISGLYLIAACRDDEVSGGKIFTAALEAMEQEGCHIHRLALTPLTPDDVEALLSDSLHCPTEAIAALSTLLMLRADGNPFLINELLEALYRDGLLRMDLACGQWRWNLEQIRAHGITEHAADLMASKILRLGGEAQEVLKVASCLGNRFDLETLCLIREKTFAETTPSIEAAAAVGLLIPGNPEMGDLEALSPAQTSRAFRFAHDKVLQAAYSLFSPDERLRLHYTIGKKLLEVSQGGKELRARAFDIANHWNLCQPLLEAEDERKALARLNLFAGKQAKDSAAFQAAFDLLTKGLSLFEPAWWPGEHDLGMELHIEAAEAAYLNGQYERMEGCIQAALEKSASLEDRIRALDIQIHADVNRNRYQEAIRTTLALLSQLDIHFPTKVTRVHLLVVFLQLKLRLAGKKVAGLIDRPTLTSFSQLSAMRLIVNLGVPAYLLDINLYGYLVLQSVQLSLRHGNSSFSAVVFTGYGVLLCGVVGDLDSGYRYGQLARRLLEKFQEKRLRGFVLFVVSNFIDHWKRPLLETLTTLQEGHQHALDNGDLIAAAYSAAHYCYHSFFCAPDLDRLKGECESYRVLLQRIGKRDTLLTLGIFEQVVLNLVQPGECPTRLVGAAYDEELSINEQLRTGDRVNSFNVHATKLILCCLFQDYPKALECTEKARQNLDSVMSSYSYAAYHFYDSLVQLGWCLRVSSIRKKAILGRVGKNLRKLKKWAHHSPTNHLHKFLLVEAERLQLLGKDTRAAALYDQAIRLTREHLMLGDEALALELAACFYQARGKLHLTRSYIQEARYAYLRWGAHAKVRDIEKRFSFFLPGEP